MLGTTAHFIHQLPPFTVPFAVVSPIGSTTVAGEDTNFSHLGMKWLEPKWLEPGFSDTTQRRTLEPRTAVGSPRKSLESARWTRGGRSRPRCTSQISSDGEPGGFRPSRQRREPGMKRTTDTSTSRRKFVSEFGETLGCWCCFAIRQLHTEECRARMTARMENDPAHREAAQGQSEQEKRIRHSGDDGCCAQRGHNRCDETSASRRMGNATRIRRHWRSFKQFG